MHSKALKKLFQNKKLKKNLFCFISQSSTSIELKQVPYSHICFQVGVMVESQLDSRGYRFMNPKFSVFFRYGVNSAFQFRILFAGSLNDIILRAGAIAASDTLWVPEFCRALHMQREGRYWYPEREVSLSVSPRDSIPQYLKKSAFGFFQEPAKNFVYSLNVSKHLAGCFFPPTGKSFKTKKTNHQRTADFGERTSACEEKQRKQTNRAFVSLAFFRQRIDLTFFRQRIDLTRNASQRNFFVTG